MESKKGVGSLRPFLIFNEVPNCLGQLVPLGEPLVVTTKNIMLTRKRPKGFTREHLFENCGDLGSDFPIGKTMAPVGSDKFSLDASINVTEAATLEKLPQ